MQEDKMITAVRQKVKGKTGGQIENRSPGFEPGIIAEVIVLFVGMFWSVPYFVTKFLNQRSDGSPGKKIGKNLW
jgi:hypothetical protein